MLLRSLRNSGRTRTHMYIMYQAYPHTSKCLCTHTLITHMHTLAQTHKYAHTRTHVHFNMDLHTRIMQILAGAQDLGIDDEALMHVTDSIMLLLQHDEGMLPFSFEEGQRLLEIPSQYGTRGSNAQEKLSSCWGQFQLAFYGF
mmetsp:Transcript_3572/g.5721  ORF Transcript_3572/g.5721 Transcript_3572/m.5721 type:complete len:143 (-) Transcript_3572:305-733(-)